MTFTKCSNNETSKSFCFTNTQIWSSSMPASETWACLWYGHFNRSALSCIGSCDNGVKLLLANNRPAENQRPSLYSPQMPIHLGPPPCPPSVCLPDIHTAQGPYTKGSLQSYLSPLLFLCPVRHHLFIHHDPENKEGNENTPFSLFFSSFKCFPAD